MRAVATCLWFNGEAEQAANFYVSLIPNSRIVDIMRSPIDWPAGRSGDVVVVDFELNGSQVQALNGGSGPVFSEAVSLSVTCEDQDELDTIWSGLIADRGSPIQCGWLKDRFGVRWQVVPRAFHNLMSSEDEAVRRRVFEAMIGMVKLDVAGLERAARDG